MMRFAQWLADFRWALNAMRARRMRRMFKGDRRALFDQHLRPWLPGAGRVPYPDGFYHIGVDDVIRATEIARCHRNRDDMGRAVCG